MNQEQTNDYLEQAKVKQAEVNEKEKYLETTASFNLKSFVKDTKNGKKSISTGFENIDKVLDGGLYAGLYCIGAISSLGKTSFCLQIADNIAKGGRDVLIFSLEMARNELIAKSISRLTFLYSIDNNNPKYAKTTRDILTESYEVKKISFEAAINKYRDYAKHIFIQEGIGDIDVKKIREIVEKHKRITGNTPIVLVDYIQILAPVEKGNTDKQNIDKAVIELKKISRDYDTVVIGISSFNRQNYNAPVNMTSFKESGAIEFSSDVLIALQYMGMDWQEGESERERNKRIKSIIQKATEDGGNGKAQSIQVKILKNRNGKKGDVCLNFYPKFNHFVEKKRIES